MAAPILPLLGAAALAAYLFTSGGAKAAKPDVPPQVPASVLQRMAKAIATNNPTAIRAEATRLLEEGWQMQAAELYRVANEIEAGRAKAVPVKAAAKPKPKPAPAKPKLPAAAAASPHTVAPKADVRIVSPLDTVKDPSPGARTLRAGMSGADVATWQRQLAAFGYAVPGNGKFDAATVTATKRFQSDSIETYRDPRIKADGIVGPDTRKLVVGRANAKGMRLVAPVQTAPGQAPIADPVKQAQAAEAQRTAANALKFGKPAVAPVPVVIAPSPATTAAKPAALADAGGSPLDRVADPTPNARVLKRGVPDGPDVKGWQAQLKAFGYQLGTFGPNRDGVDGNFGGATETATKKFQADGLALYKDKRIAIDGIVGPTTRKLVVLRKAGVQPVVAGDELGRDSADLPNIALADTPLPGIIPPAVDTTPIDPERLLAGRVAAMLIEAPAGKEDRTLIGRFQAQEGIKPTGLYGPGTAIALVRYGIAPPWPRAWTKKNRIATRTRYREVLLAQAEKDPARADEWRGAALERL